MGYYVNIECRSCEGTGKHSKPSGHYKHVHGSGLCVDCEGAGLQKISSERFIRMKEVGLCVSLLSAYGRSK